MAKYVDVDLAIELHNGKLWAWDVYDLEPFLDDVPACNVVEVRHGEWEEHDESKDDFYHHRCSICKVDAPFDYVQTEDYDEGTDGEWYSMGLRITDIVEHITNYCPNCGAKMDGKGEGE